MKKNRKRFLFKKRKIKVVASILFFPLVLRIDFKSAEELKLQPKTHEEYLATRNENEPVNDDDDDDYDSDDYNSGAFSTEHSQRRLSDENLQNKSFKIENDTSIEFLIENKHVDNESIEMTSLSNDNKSINDRTHSPSTNLKQTLSTPLQQLDEINELSTELPKTTDELTSLNENLTTRKTTLSSSISVTQRFYEFYNAPITKFWYNAIFYLLFLFLFTYMILVRTPARPSVAGRLFY
jgi:hypothetical protein